MKVKIYSQDERTITLLLGETNVSNVNSIRRAIMTDVPKMAISKVRFEMGVRDPDSNGERFESVSSVSDEVVAHRLALLPIPTFFEDFVFPKDDPANQGIPEDKWGSPASRIIYHCSVQGPGKEDEEEFRSVSAGDLNVLGDSKLQIPEHCRDIPITLLAKGQYIEFYAYASLGRGVEHAKWAPAAGVGFYQNVKAVLKDKKAAKHIFSLDIKLNDGKVLTEKIFGKGAVTDIDTVEAIRKALLFTDKRVGSEGESGIIMEEIPGEFVLHYESDGALSPVDIFNHACDELESRFDSLGEQLKIALS
jgi:DNA-directed RNA polymerase subunit D